MMIWIYWLIGTLCYFYQFVFRTIFGTLGDDITSKFQISVSDLSTFFAAGMLAYPLMQIPAGILLDRYGPRRMLTVAMACLSLGILIVSLTSSFQLALVGRVLMGAGSAFGFIGTSKIVTVWFPLPMMGFLLGVTVFLGSMGGAFSKQMFDALPTHWGLSQSLTVIGLLGVALSVGIALILREKKNVSVGSSGAEPVKKTSFIQDLKTIFSTPQILIAAFFTFFGYLPISIIADSWGPIAFQNMFGATKEIADQTVTYFYMAFAVGSLVYSSMVTNLNRIRYILFFGFALSLGFIYLLLIETSVGMSVFFGIPGFLLLSAAIGFNLGGVALAFPIGCSHAPKEISATIVGVMNMLCMVSGGVFSKLVGSLLNFYWDGSKTADGSPIFSAATYQSALKPMIVTTVIALILISFIRAGDSDTSMTKA